jgi:hypothetical protein
MNWRSAWAVVAGVPVIIVVTTLVDIVLHVTGVFPLLAIPQCWVGGKVHEIQSATR